MIRRQISAMAVMVVAGFWAGFLSGCNQEHRVESRYQCEGGQVLNASFVDGQYVDITLDDITHRIPRVQSASSVQYENADEGRLFWSKGIDALYIPQKGAAPLKCRRG